MNQTPVKSQSTDLELISFKLCPFVQRSVITLLEKKVTFKITYIELDDPPPWFLQLSPLGKVPLLRVGDTALFESAVINEYLDEVTPPSLHPSDPLQKAKNRSWIEFASVLLGHTYRIMTTEDESTYKQEKQELLDKFKQLEAQLAQGPYFNGQQFNLIDCAFAPLFKHIATINKSHALDLYNNNPKLDTWQSALLSRPAVQSSVVEDYDALYTAYLQQANGYVINN